MQNELVSVRNFILFLHLWDKLNSSLQSMAQHHGPIVSEMAFGLVYPYGSLNLIQPDQVVSGNISSLFHTYETIDLNFSKQRQSLGVVYIFFFNFMSWKSETGAFGLVYPYRSLNLTQPD